MGKKKKKFRHSLQFGVVGNNRITRHLDVVSKEGEREAPSLQDVEPLRMDPFVEACLRVPKVDVSISDDVKRFMPGLVSFGLNAPSIEKRAGRRRRRRLGSYNVGCRNRTRGRRNSHYGRRAICRFGRHTPRAH